MLNQFRARNIPWGILIPRFKMMMARDEHEREQRIRRNAEASFQAAKLPPRMQAHVDETRRKKENDLESTQGSQ
jgi:Sec-independent protein translocase protein TatA